MTGVPAWEMRVEAPSHRDVIALAEHLAAQGWRVRRRPRSLIVWANRPGCPAFRQTIPATEMRPDPGRTPGPPGYVPGGPIRIPYTTGLNPPAPKPRGTPTVATGQRPQPFNVCK